MWWLIYTFVFQPFFNCCGWHVCWRQKRNLVVSSRLSRLCCMTSIRQAAGCMNLVQLESVGRDSNTVCWVVLYLGLWCRRRTERSRCATSTMRKIQSELRNSCRSGSFWY
jgi:hypothetical protein